MSQFDPEAFLQTQTDEALEDRYSPVPEGTYRGMVINDPDNEARQIKVRDAVQKRGENAGQTLYFLDVPILIDAPDQEDAHNKVVRFSSILDLTESGGLATGPNRNVRLGALRTAVGQNQPGQPWKPMDLEGQVLTITVKHDAEGRFANVEEVAPAT